MPTEILWIAAKLFRVILDNNAVGLVAETIWQYFAAAVYASE